MPPAGKRWRVIRLYDGIIPINKLKISVLEHGRVFVDENGQKWSTDSLKTAKVLHYILYLFQSQVPPPTVLGQMQVVCYGA